MYRIKVAVVGGAINKLILNLEGSRSLKGGSAICCLPCYCRRLEDPLYDPTIWPEGAAIRRYVLPKRNTGSKNGESTDLHSK